jgi:hypothetical protein
MSDPTRPWAPEPIGEIVPGQPPVPITVWQVPAPAGPATLSLPMAQRLVAGFTHPSELVCDLTVGPQLARAAMSAHRRHTTGGGGELAALTVVPWPPEVDPAGVLAGCRDRTHPGGHLALVVATGQVTIPQRLIAAGQAAGLTYLQHYIAAHQLCAGGTRLRVHGRHLRVHTDLVVLARPARVEDG